ncbi:MmgE/PrpD family protein [Arthrobacter methylotrophus]|uniref:MmgE/PrpD family protein n=1 Tax=Arthrobacter methylotrophus TaxID=121291 RepID=A0ABV5UJN1_9MICC
MVTAELPAAKGAQADATLSERFARFVAGLVFADLPPAVTEKARICLLHQLGMGLAAHGIACVGQAAHIAAREQARPTATMLHGGERTSAMNAAFANGALFHARVQDDTHHTAHLGTAVISAALAVAEERGANGADLLAAMVAGYEIAGGLSREYTALTTPRGIRATGVFGVIGAAAAAAKLMGLNEADTAHALGIAAGFACGTSEPFGAGSPEFHFNNGQAAKNGILAAIMAEEGVTAASTAFEGVAGYLQAYAGDRTEPFRAAAELGQTYEILNVNLKPLPVCAGNQVPVRNAKILAERIGDISQVQSIRIEMNPYEANHPGIAGYGPFRNRVNTLMSTPFCVALGLLGTDITLAAMESYDDPGVRRLVCLSKVVAADDLRMLQSRITVRLLDGSEFENTLALGERDWRPSFAQEAGLLAAMNAEMPIDAERLSDLVEHVQNIGEAASVDQLVWLCVAYPTEQ